MTQLIYSIVGTGLLLLALVSCQLQPGTSSPVSAKDSTQVFQLFAQAYDVQNTNPDSAYSLIRQAGALSRKTGFDQGLINYYNQAMYNRAAYRGDFALAKR